MVPKELVKALRAIEIKTNRLANEQLSGNYTSSFKGQGLAFREVRPYQPGDDVRTIDWNVSARMSETFVKVFVEEREMTVMLVVDLSASALFGSVRMSKARLASEVAALLSFSAIKKGDRIGLILGSSEVERIVPPRKGDKHVMRVVREILGHELPEGLVHAALPGRRAPLGAGTDLAGMLETLTRTAKRRSVAFVLSDFFAEGFDHALTLAAAKHDVIPVVLTDPLEATLPDVGLATLEDLETGAPMLVDTSDPRVRAAWRTGFDREAGRRKQLFHKLGLDSVTLETNKPYVKILRDLFARRARRMHG